MCFLAPGGATSAGHAAGQRLSSHRAWQNVERVVGGGAALTPDQLQSMKGVIASTSKALRRAKGKDTALLLRRAALLVALGEAALA